MRYGEVGGGRPGGGGGGEDVEQLKADVEALQQLLSDLDSEVDQASASAANALTAAQGAASGVAAGRTYSGASIYGPATSGSTVQVTRTPLTFSSGDWTSSGGIIIPGRYASLKSVAVRVYVGRSGVQMRYVVWSWNGSAWSLVKDLGLVDASTAGLKKITTSLDHSRRA